ncbi:MAG: glycerol-3-phosphate dehydrogenase/oxidase [Nitrospinota bacterium]
MNLTTREVCLKECEKSHFDMVVIGGGITGAGVARDAAMRGLKCLLLEKDDFASGTSSKSSKLVHGGLRYLKYYNFRLVYEGCRERYILLKKTAPHLVRAIRFVFPFYKGAKNPRWLIALGLSLYGLLAMFRNIHLFRFISTKKLFEEEPYLRKQGCVGGLTYYDCKGMDSRLVIDTIKSAVDNKAVPLNYCEVTKLDFVKNGVKVSATDNIGGKKYVFSATMAVNAGGAWADDILDKCGETKKFNLQMASGIHLIFRREKLSVNNTLLVEAPEDGRPVFFIPWKENILVGTTDKYFDGNKDKILVRRDSIDYLLNTVNHYFPDANLNRSDVRSVFSGVRTLIADITGKTEDEATRDEAILIDKRGIVSITGGKLTTYRAMAKKAVGESITNFFKGRNLKSCGTISPISGGDMNEVKRIKDKQYDFLKPGQLETLCERYGSNASTILEYCKAEPELCGYIHPHFTYCRAELKYFVEREICEKLTDVMFRRSQIYLFETDNGMPVMRDVASFIGKLKGWDEHRLEEEINQYREWVDFLTQDLNP